MKNNPLVSVVLIVRNGERYLAEAIKSVLAQDYQPIEILVVDGQSTDRTAEIAQSFSSVRYLYQHDLGIANAYNLGIDTAQGEFIAFFSHDDLWVTHKLKVQVNYLLNHPDVAYTIGKVKFFWDSEYTLPSSLNPEPFAQDEPNRILEVLLARKTLFERIGKFNPEIAFSNDVDWWSRVEDAGIVGGIIPEVLLHKRVHPNSTILSNQETVKQELWSILKQSIDRKRSRKVK